MEKIVLLYCHEGQDIFLHFICSPKFRFRETSSWYFLMLLFHINCVLDRDLTVHTVLHYCIRFTVAEGLCALPDFVCFGWIFLLLIAGIISNFHSQSVQLDQMWIKLILYSYQLGLEYCIWGERDNTIKPILNMIYYLAKF